MAVAAAHKPRVCLVGFGSAGDVHPLLALGQGLRARGHPVALLTNPAYARAAGEADLEFVPVGEESQQQETATHPKLWHPIDGFGVMWRYLLRPALVPTYERLAELAAEGPCVVIASPVAMGARVAQEHLGLPLVTTYTAATLLRTVSNPMTLAQWRVPPWLPRGLRQAAWSWLDRNKLEPLVLPALEGLRSQLGLAPLAGSVFGQWMHSPQAGLALFPPWFAPAAPDWPAQVVQSGFPLYDDAPPAAPSRALREFLDGGKPPVVFMPGTAQREAGPFFAAAARACEQAGARGLLLGAVEEELARRLPPALHAEPYLPFGWLLPRARALVHHGGIGSCAQALRAGLPQLVLPKAYDQFDNAMRLEHLGVGRGFSGPLETLGPALRQLLADADVQSACRRWAPEVSPAPAQEAAARLVEQLA